MLDVIIVDDLDREIGVMEKMEAHRLGLLHRAFSVLVVNSNNCLLIHRRAMGKYHSPGLWTNTCCSHPLPGEDVHAAARRRLKEEMGMEGVELEATGSFIYRVELDNGLVEYEFDHVFKGVSDRQPEPDPAEADSVEWIARDALLQRMQENPAQFTFWFREIIKRGFF